MPADQMVSPDVSVFVCACDRFVPSRPVRKKHNQIINADTRIMGLKLEAFPTAACDTRLAQVKQRHILVSNNPCLNDLTEIAVGTIASPRHFICP